MLTFPPTTTSLGDLWTTPYYPPSGRSGGVPPPPSMTNAQKLSLVLTPVASQTSRATQIDYGQSVSVTDGTPSGVVQTLQPPSDSFVVSGEPDSLLNGLYLRGNVLNGRPAFRKIGHALTGLTSASSYAIFWDGALWNLNDEDGFQYDTGIGGDVPLPYLGTWAGSITPATNADPTVVVVSGAGTAEANGIYPLKVSPQFNDRPTYGTDDQSIRYALDIASEFGLGPSEAGWVIIPTGADPAYYSDDVLHPWLSSAWTLIAGVGDSPAPTVTAQIQHPAVFVSGAGTAAANGIYTARGVSNGRPYYNLLRSADDSLTALTWDGNHWIVNNLEGYYYDAGNNDVFFPWLVPTWTADAGTAPAPTLTPVTQGELDAGLFVTNDGVTNGSSYVLQPFHGRQYYMGLNGGGSNNMHWDTDYNVWTDDVGEWTADDVAFPWQGTDAHLAHDGATFARNDVAAEANWT